MKLIGLGQEFWIQIAIVAGDGKKGIAALDGIRSRVGTQGAVAWEGTAGLRNIHSHARVEYLAVIESIQAHQIIRMDIKPSG
jgi:hypothetical protein